MPNIAEIKKQLAKTMIVNPGLVALCTDVMDRKTGTGQYGDWALQPIALKDDSGEIKAIIWNRPDLAAIKGKNVHLSALQGDKGWSGCMVEDNLYNGTTYKQIKASGNFLLEEYKPPAVTSELAAQGVGNGHAEPGPEKDRSPSGPPVWEEYSAVVKAVHKLANQLEPDTGPIEGGFTPDRARARAAIVNTILIRYGNKDFKYELTDDDIPF